MNKVDEVSSEFEFSSGWKKIIKDNSRDRISEELRAKIEEMQMKLENLNSAITNLGIKERIVEKTPSEDICMEKIIMNKIIEFNTSITEIEGKLNNIQSSVIQYKNLLDNQNSMLGEIINNLRIREDTDASTQKGFIANIFKKK